MATASQPTNLTRWFVSLSKHVGKPLTILMLSRKRENIYLDGVRGRLPWPEVEAALAKLQLVTEIR